MRIAKSVCFKHNRWIWNHENLALIAVFYGIPYAFISIAFGVSYYVFDIPQEISRGISILLLALGALNLGLLFIFSGRYSWEWRKAWKRVVVLPKNTKVIICDDTGKNHYIKLEETLTLQLPNEVIEPYIEEGRVHVDRADWIAVEEKQ